MDPVILLALSLIGIMVIFRIWFTFRKSRMGQLDQIQQELDRLRKKRDEE